jgi:hypothetical protein
MAMKHKIQALFLSKSVTQFVAKLLPLYESPEHYTQILRDNHHQVRQQASPFVILTIHSNMAMCRVKHHECLVIHFGSAPITSCVTQRKYKIT